MSRKFLFSYSVRLNVLYRANLLVHKFWYVRTIYYEALAMTLAISFYHLEIKGLPHYAVRCLSSIQENNSFTFFSYSLFFSFTGSYSFIMCVCIVHPTETDGLYYGLKIECNSITNFILITNFPVRLLRSLLVYNLPPFARHFKCVVQMWGNFKVSLYTSNNFL
jgi:hypothetical protein